MNSFCVFVYFLKVIWVSNFNCFIILPLTRKSAAVTGAHLAVTSVMKKDIVQNLAGITDFLVHFLTQKFEIWGVNWGLILLQVRSQKKSTGYLSKFDSNF